MIGPRKLRHGRLGDELGELHALQGGMRSMEQHRGQLGAVDAQPQVLGVLERCPGVGGLFEASHFLV